MTADTITAIKRALEKVYVGEWYISHVKTNGLSVVHSASDSSMFGITAETFEAEYVVAANPFAVSELLSTLESLQRENEENQELARAFEAEANQLREVSIANRHRADRAEAELKRLEEWKPISEADTSITNTITMPGLTIRNSDSYWVRDDDGRIYEACWTDHRNGYWWDIEGESPVDPVEFMPHPLSRSSLSSTGDTHGN